MRYCPILLFILISQLVQAQTSMPTPTSSTLSFNTNATVTNNMTATIGSITLSLPFAPSPTTFVFTHFPLPIHTGSSSSMMSSARPSQSAPFPDDTIGKYGRLHINNAPPLLHSTTYYAYMVLLVVFFV